jgi:hypothetical protein
MTAIIAELSPSFNEKAADTAQVLGKYNAVVNWNSALFVSGSADGFLPVSGVREQDTQAFLKEFRTLPGVKAVYKKPADSCPSL